MSDGERAAVMLSITSIPERIELLLAHFDWYRRQTVKPQRAVIWLDEAVFSAADCAALQQRFGLPAEVTLCRRADLGPQTKLLHALREYGELPIVTADDDIIYPADWFGGLAAAYRRAPQHIHAWRAHRVVIGEDGHPAPYATWRWLAPGEQGPSAWLFPTGTGGVLYPPGALADEVHDLATMRKLCPTADDIWFKAMALMRGTAAQKVAPESREFPHIAGSERRMLWTINRDRNDSQLAAVFGRYQLAERLRAWVGFDG
jgi:hypothetical protein